MEKPLVSGIAYNRDEAKISVVGVPDMPGVAYRVLGPIGAANIEVDVIVQNIAANGTNDLTFTVNRGDLQRAKKILDEIVPELGAKEVITADDIVKVSLVGVGMRSHAGVAARMFKTLADENINIQMITTSEIKISVIINERYLELALRALHTAFDLDRATDETAE